MVMTADNRHKNPIWKFISKYYIYILSTGIPALIMLGVWIIAKIGPGGRSLIIVDGLHQYIPFFADYYGKLKSFDQLFYSFHEGMGTNFLALWSYYLASPLNLLILFFPKNQLNTAVSLIVTLKIIASGWTFAYASLHRRHVKYQHPGVIPLAVAYAMSNYVIGYYWNVMWMDCIFILPLIVLGYDYLVEKKDPRLYIFTLAYALFCNYYIGFMVCIFLVLWALFYHYDDLKQLGRSAWMFALSSLLSGALAAIVMVPAYKGIMQTASAKRSLPGFDQYGSYVDILQTHFLFTEPINNQVADGGTNLYSGMFTLFLLLIYLLSKEFKLTDKLRRVILLAIFYVSFNTEILNYIWHGFHNQYGIPNRFSFLYTFVLLWIGYEVLLRLRRISALAVALSGAGCLGLIILCFKQSAEPFSKNQYLYLAGIILVYTLITLFYNYRKEKGKIWRAILAGLMTVEMTGGAIFGWYSNGTVDVDYYFHDTDEVAEVVQALQSEDDSFYRMELGHRRMLDEPTWHNLNCVTLFGSTARGDVVTAMGRLGFYTGANEYLYQGATPLTNAITGVKYVLYREGDYNNNQLSFKMTQNNISVYENPWQLPVGFAVSRDLIDQRMTGTYFDVENEYARAATEIDAPLFTKVLPTITAGADTSIVTVTDNIVAYSNHTSNSELISMSMVVPEDMDLYLDVSGGNVRQIKFFMDDQLLADDRFQGQAFYIGYVTKGQELTFQFKLNDGSQSGAITIHAASFDNSVWSAVYDKLREHVIELDEYDTNYFRGTIETVEDQAVFFSIPYEEGWTVKVDGEEVIAERVFDAFIAVPLEAGTHEIELHYVSEGFYLGVAVSIAGILLLAAYLYLLKQLRKKWELVAVAEHELEEPEGSLEGRNEEDHEDSLEDLQEEGLEGGIEKLQEEGLEGRKEEDCLEKTGADRSESKLGE